MNVHVHCKTLSLCSPLFQYRKPLSSITVQAKMHDAMNSIYIPLKCFFFEHCQEHWPACKNSCWAPTLTARSTQMGCREVRGRAYRGSHTHTHLYTRTHTPPVTPLGKIPGATPERSQIGNRTRAGGLHDGSAHHCAAGALALKCNSVVLSGYALEVYML